MATKKDFRDFVNEFLGTKGTKAKTKVAPKRKANPVKKAAPKRRVAKPATVAKKAAPKRRANPLMKDARSKKKANFPYLVETKNTENWNTSAAFKTKDEAVVYAKDLAARYPKLPVRVLHYTGGPM